MVVMMIVLGLALLFSVAMATENGPSVGNFLYILYLLAAYTVFVAVILTGMGAVVWL